MKWLDFLHQRLIDREAQQVYRYRQQVHQARSARQADIAHRSYCNFGSNDYLGLSTHPRLIEATRTAARQGIGSSCSGLITGYREAHAAFEAEAAQFVGFPKALLFGSGYLANVGLLSAILKPNDVIYADRLSHASLNDGCRLSGARLKRFKHNDITHLETLLKQHDPQKRAVIITEALFSMDGDAAPIEALLDLANRYDTLLIVDEAHSFGIYGSHGQGLLSQKKISSDRIILVAPLGKAAGCYGAFVAAHPAIIDNLVQFAKPYIYSTATPTPIVETLRVSLKMIEAADQHRLKLQKNIDYFRSLNACPLPDNHSAQSPIFPYLIGENELAITISQRLMDQGCLVPAIRPPTVPARQARLRVSLNACHSKGDIDRLYKALEQIKPLLSQAGQDTATL